MHFKHPTRRTLVGFLAGLIGCLTAPKGEAVTPRHSPTPAPVPGSTKGAVHSAPFTWVLTASGREITTYATWTT